jgi:hypothetical protein
MDRQMDFNIRLHFYRSNSYVAGPLPPFLEVLLPFLVAFAPRDPLLCAPQVTLVVGRGQDNVGRHIFGGGLN